MTKVYTSQNHIITGFYTFSTYIQALTKGIKLSTDAYPTIGIYPSVDNPPHLLFYDAYEGLLSLSDLLGGGFQNPAVEDLQMGNYSIIFGSPIGTSHSIYIPSGYTAYIDKLQTPTRLKLPVGSNMYG